MNVNTDANTTPEAEAAPTPKTVIRGHHHFFTVASEDFAGCMKACVERGLRFVGARRTGYYVPPQKKLSDAEEAAAASAGHHPTTRYIAIDDSKVEGSKTKGFRVARPEMERCFVQLFSWDVKAAESKEQNAARLKQEADAESARQVSALFAAIDGVDPKPLVVGAAEPQQ